ncbi:hypothetical protein [Nitrosovibrio sp. Nv17]|uniref:hypothetical protein n=1 Tax=Nitrosovibrio sp. Nv17 TaxID=1855339 RepID=UPI000B2B0B2C|nr:hypothetical protein [Nitrosovibrio sp. Nv17]
MALPDGNARRPHLILPASATLRDGKRPDEENPILDVELCGILAVEVPSAELYAPVTLRARDIVHTSAAGIGIFNT